MWSRFLSSDVMNATAYLNTRNYSQPKIQKKNNDRNILCCSRAYESGHFTSHFIHNMSLSALIKHLLTAKQYLTKSLLSATLNFHFINGRFIH